MKFNFIATNFIGYFSDLFKNFNHFRPFQLIFDQISTRFLHFLPFLVVHQTLETIFHSTFVQFPSNSAIFSTNFSNLEPILVDRRPFFTIFQRPFVQPAANFGAFAVIPPGSSCLKVKNFNLVQFGGRLPEIRQHPASNPKRLDWVANSIGRPPSFDLCHTSAKSSLFSLFNGKSTLIRFFLNSFRLITAIWLEKWRAMIVKWPLPVAILFCNVDRTIKNQREDQ